MHDTSDLCKGSEDVWEQGVENIWPEGAEGTEDFRKIHESIEVCFYNKYYRGASDGEELVYGTC